VVAGYGEHALAVCCRFHHRYGQYHGRNRCTNRSDANRTANVWSKPMQKCAGNLRR
jgi:hypothetical protein